MQELFEQLCSIARGIWLKKRFIVLISWIICPLGWYQVKQLPDQYEAKARVYVNTQSLLKPLLRGLTINTNPQDQVELMVRTLLSRPNLEKIVRMTDMDIRAVTQKDTNALIQKLKRNIQITTTGQKNLYTLTYRGESPAFATEVVKAALAVFMENTLGQSRNDNQTAKRFLQQQISDYEKRLDQSDRQLTAFKRKNGALIGSQGGGYYKTLASHQGRLDEATLALKEKEIQLASAKAQLLGEEPSFGLVNAGGARHQFSSQYDQRIATLQESLDQLSLRFTAEYPDVRELNQRIADLESLREAELRSFESLSHMTQSSGNSGTLNTNVVYQELKLSVTTLTNEVASLRVRVANFQEKVDALKQKIHLVPQIEAELAALRRGYQATKNKYDALVTRRETALLAERADQSVEDIQFKLIDPARASDKPTGPFRILYYSGVTLVGIGAGVALALLLSQLSPVAITAYQLTQLTGIPVLGAVTMDNEHEIVRNSRRHSMLFLFFLTSLIACYVLMVAIEASPQLLPSIFDVIKGIRQ